MTCRCRSACSETTASAVGPGLRCRRSMRDWRTLRRMSATEGLEIYLVGGAVRDRLLGRRCGERDFVVVGATVGDLLARGFQQVGKDFPGLSASPDQGRIRLGAHRAQDRARLSRLRRPCRSGRSRSRRICCAGISPSMRWLRTRPVLLIDPYGGLADLQARVLRHVSPGLCRRSGADPAARPVCRALRRPRLPRRGRDRELMREMVAAGEVDALVPERVWQELSRALGEDRPSRFFEVLRECGALARLLPEVDRLWGVPQPAQWHPEIDTGVHVMLVIDMAARLSPDLEVRFAALCHDLGKGTTPPRSCRATGGTRNAASSCSRPSASVAHPHPLAASLPASRRAITAWSTRSTNCARRPSSICSKAPTPSAGRSASSRC